MDESDENLTNEQKLYFDIFNQYFPDSEDETLKANVIAAMHDYYHQRKQLESEQ